MNSPSTVPGRPPEFDELVDRLNDHYEFDLTKKRSGYGPSDSHVVLYQEIPVLFPFTGLHRDYHRPSDDWDKINVEGLRHFTDFSTELVTAIEEMPQRPTYVEKGRWGSMFDGFRRGNRSRRGSDPNDRQPESQPPADANQPKETGTSDPNPE